MDHFHIHYPQQVHAGGGQVEFQEVQDPRPYRHRTQAYRARKRLLAETRLPPGLVTVRATCPRDCLRGADSDA